MDSVIREYERRASNGDPSAARRLIELKKRCHALEIYIVEEHTFDLSFIRDIFFTLEDAEACVLEKYEQYRRYKAKKKPLKWEKLPTDSMHSDAAELSFIWRPVDFDRISDTSYSITCFIK